MAASLDLTASPVAQMGDADGHLSANIDYASEWASQPATRDRTASTRMRIHSSIVTGLVALAWFVLMCAAPTGALAGMIRLVQDLPLGTTEGYNNPAWSFDSRYVAFSTGLKVGFIEIATGAVKIVPNSDMDFYISGVAWSLDGTLIAASTLDQIKIFRVSDLSLVREVKAARDFGNRYRFGAVQFSPDGKRLLIAEARPLNHDLLLSLDWNSNQITTLVASPFGDRKVEADDAESRFVWSGHRLFFSTRLMRFDEYQHPAPGQPGSDDPLVSSKPSSCYSFLVDGDVVASREHLDVPPAGAKPTFDDNGYIFDCRYLPAQDAFVVRRKVPDPAPQFAPLHVYYDVVAASTGNLISSFGHVEPPESLDDDDNYELHPVHPWAVNIVGVHDTGQILMMIWNTATGAKLDELPLRSFEYGPRISPDGRLMVTRSFRDDMPVYDFEQ